MIKIIEGMFQNVDNFSKIYLFTHLNYPGAASRRPLRWNVVTERIQLKCAHH